MTFFLVIDNLYQVFKIFFPDLFLLSCWQLLFQSRSEYAGWMLVFIYAGVASCCSIMVMLELLTIAVKESHDSTCLRCGALFRHVDFDSRTLCSFIMLPLHCCWWWCVLLRCIVTQWLTITLYLIILGFRESMICRDSWRQCLNMASSICHWTFKSMA